jgi:TPR repeat protein
MARSEGFFSKVKDFLSSDSNKSLISKLTTQLHDMGDILNLALTAQTSNNMQAMLKLITDKQAEKLPEIQKSNTELGKNVDTFVKNISQVFNLSSNSSATANSTNSVNVVINSPVAHQTGRDSPPLETRFQHIEEEKRLYVLRRLKELFRDRDRGEKSKNFQIYNEILSVYGWELGYKNDLHTLYINDEAVPSEIVLKEISKQIATIQPSIKSPVPQNSGMIPSPSPSPKTPKQDAKDKNNNNNSGPNNPLMISAFKNLTTNSGSISTTTSAANTSASTAAAVSTTASTGTSSKASTTSVATGVGSSSKPIQVSSGSAFAAIPSSKPQQTPSASVSIDATSGQVSSIQLMNMDFKGLLAWASKGHAMAQYVLGKHYRDGTNGCVKNDSKALEWYQKSAAQGNGCAQRSIGYMHEDGLGGLKKDPAQALKLYLDARESLAQLEEDVFVQYNLGVMYQNGQGVTQDLKQAAEWYQKAANKGYALAQGNLGFMYHNAQGVTQDLKQAVEWYQKAANQGYANAQSSLGFMYGNGQGVTQDLKQAVEWYQKAANQGYAYAQDKLGDMYYSGQGVTKDLKQAVEWYQKAANQGYPSAIYSLAKIPAKFKPGK